MDVCGRDGCLVVIGAVLQHRRLCIDHHGGESEAGLVIGIVCGREGGCRIADVGYMNAALAGQDLGQ